MDTTDQQEQEQDEPELSKEMAIAQRTYHLLLLKMHLEAIRVFMEPIVDKDTFKHADKIIRLCVKALDERSTELMDSLLDNIVKQLECVTLYTTVDLLKFMLDGRSLFMAFNYHGQIVSVPMHDIYKNIIHKLV